MTADQIAALKSRGHIVDLRGKDYITHAGLLEMAHADGIQSVLTEIVSWDFKARAAVVLATAAGERGTFTGIGDACPDNVGRNIAGATLRMAETRAINRALRSYLGIGMTTAEEMPGDSGGRRQETRRQPSNGSPRTVVNPKPQQYDDQHSGQWRNNDGDAPCCPACGSQLWDNTAKRASGWKGPAWKCKGRDCTGHNGEPWLQWQSEPVPGMVDPSQGDAPQRGEGPPPFDDESIPF